MAAAAWPSKTKVNLIVDREALDEPDLIFKA